MTGIDPDDPAQVDVLAGIIIEDAYECQLEDVHAESAYDARWAAKKYLIGLRDHLAAQPRVIELPEEDRTRRWMDRDGTTWDPVRDHGEDLWCAAGEILTRPWYQWVQLLDRFTPLTDAGPA